MKNMSDALSQRNIRFLCVSNEQVDKNNYQGLDVVTGPEDPVGDLFALASCDYIIGPPSTFSIFASYFGDVPLYVINEPSDLFQLDSFTVFSGL